MRDELDSGESKPVNKRNLLIVLGAIGGIWLVSNIGGPDFNFNIGDDDGPPAIVQIGGSDEDKAVAIAKADAAKDRIDAAADRLEARINAKVERELDRAASQIDDAEMDAAIAELKDGKPEHYLKLMEQQ